MKSSDFFVVNTLPATESTSIAPDELRVGTPSPANLWNMLDSLTKSYPEIAWGVRLTAQEIKLAPVLHNEELVGVQVARGQSRLYADRTPFTLDTIRRLPPELPTRSVEWECDTQQSPTHDQDCGRDICRCETIVDIRSPQIHLNSLFYELSDAFLIRTKDEPQRLAVLARIWRFIEQNGGVGEFGKNCTVEAVPGYYGEELGVTTISPEWAKGLIECTRDALSLDSTTAHALQSCAQQKLDITIPTASNPSLTPYRFLVITNAIEDAFPQVNAYPDYRNGNPLIYPHGDKLGIYIAYSQAQEITPPRPYLQSSAALHLNSRIALPKSAQMWLHEKSNTPPSLVCAPVLAVAPDRVFGEMNQILDQSLESASPSL